QLGVLSSSIELTQSTTDERPIENVPGFDGVHRPRSIPKFTQILDTDGVDRSTLESREIGTRLDSELSVDLCGRLLERKREARERHRQHPEGNQNEIPCCPSLPSLDAPSAPGYFRGNQR